MKKSLPALLAPLLLACQTATGPGQQAPLERLPRALTTQESAVLTASNRFAFGILRETVRRADGPNVFLSPLSATLALSMAANGAAGSTFDEMRDALGFGTASLADINQANRSLTELLLGLDGSIDTRIANSAWARREFPFHDSFMDTARRWYDAEVATLDFAAADASATINAWVERNTERRITSIVPDRLPGDAVLYLINAVYFKGSWRDRFDPQQTRPAPFTLADGSTRDVRMMRRTGLARYHRGTTGMQVVELPYGRGAFVMTIVLPPAGTDVDQVIETLDAATWNGWVSSLTEIEMEVAMPAYRIEYETSMNAALQALGMRQAFVRGGADFSALSPRGTDLWISDVKQKTWVDVNEEGTEAAGVTAVEIRVVSMPPSITVDRPFIVAIRERFSGAIMFLGRVGEPVAP